MLVCQSVIVWGGRPSLFFFFFFFFACLCFCNMVFQSEKVDFNAHFYMYVTFNTILTLLNMHTQMLRGSKTLSKWRTINISIPSNRISWLNWWRFYDKLWGTKSQDRHSSGAVWESRWTTWAVRPNEPSGFCGRKDLLNHASALVTTCP